jgi:outer membrane protein assembly factor BamB
MFLLSAMTGFADGWRFDGSGRFASATPVLEWGRETNIVWSKTLDTWSNGSPLPVGTRVFVTAERAVLLCLDAATGATLWSRTNDYSQVLPPGVHAELQRAEALQGKISEAARRLQADPLNISLHNQMAQLCAEVLADARSTNAAALVRQYALPPTHGDTGFSTPTPVSDGKTVFVLTALGTVARYDLDGNRLWLRLVRKPTRGWGQSASPVVADGKLLVHIDDLLYALSPATGETLWTFKGASNHGTPVTVTVGTEMFLLTTGGDLVRLSNGAGAATKLAGVSFNGPVADGDCVYTVDEGGCVAFQLVAGPTNTITAVKKWDAKPNRNRYYASPVLAGGLLYVLNAGGVLSAIDSRDGTIVYERKLELGGTAYPSLCLAGGKLFASSDTGTTVVIEPGREYRQLARNSLGEGFRSTPCFDSGRILIRGMKKVYCIGK